MELHNIVETAVSQLFDKQVQVIFSRTDPKFGDFSTNVALQISKEVGQNPREVATQIVQKINEFGEENIKEVTIAGPGFINIRLTDARLWELSNQNPARPRDNQTVVIETNNPNPFKAMHIGHAFNSILADTVANLLEKSGAQVHRVSYHGDVGLHVGKSMWSLLKYVDGDADKLQEIDPSDRNTFMSKMYADGSKEYKENPEVKEEIDYLAKQSFTLDDPIYKKVYTTCRDWSLTNITETMKRIGNKAIERRYLESEADKKGVPIVEQHVPDVFIKSDGALVFPGSKYGIFDNVFVTGRGLGLYGARDLGLMVLKNDDFHADKSYIITAEEQKDYFRNVIKAAELCLPELKDVTKNISTGTVKLTTGKMSSRDGDVVEINWLFEKIAEAVKERGGESLDAIIAGALRYQFLKVKIGSDVVFDVNEAVSLTGNSGPYLQYAHARACSLLEKAKDNGAITDDELSDEHLDEHERALLVKISEYNDVMNETMRELAPHGICHYLYELAQEFNRFYEKARIVGDARQNIRLKLVREYREKLSKGLEVLGIIPLNKL